MGIIQHNWILKTLSVLPIKHGSLYHFPETPRETLEDHWHCYITAATKLVGVFQVFPRPPIKTPIKDRYFVSGSGYGGYIPSSKIMLISSNIKIELNL